MKMEQHLLAWHSPTSPRSSCGSAQITPAGLGTVEAAIIATLVATGMTAVDATGAAIIYRLISFALMTAIGWVIYFWHYARKGLTLSSLSMPNQEKETQ